MGRSGERATGPVGVLGRREFLKVGVGGLWAALAGGTPATLAGRPARLQLYRWWPQFPIAREVWVVPFAGDPEEGMVLETAAGLAARAALRGGWRTLLYEDLPNDGYQRWFEGYCQAHRPRLRRLSLAEAVERLRGAGIVRGYLLYRYDRSERAWHMPGPADESANVATSLASLHRAVAVSERLVPWAEERRLPCLADVRAHTELRCLREHEPRFSRRLVGTSDPKSRVVRSLMVALDAFVCSGRGQAYELALARCEPDSPVLGWGCEGEDAQTIPSSRWGLYQTATNWCHNLPVFAGEAPGVHIAAHSLRCRHQLHWSELDWGDDRHHVSFVMSDGDNVQWLMGNFVGGSEAPSYYAHPRRGAVPFGWGVPAPSLAQLSPRTLAEVFGRARPNDDFVLYSAAGYLYPDLYGAARGGALALHRHAKRVRGYMELTGVRILAFNFQDWDSPAALDACRIFASRMPGLLGILAFQYYPYSAGEGTIHWVEGAGGDRVPVVSCRLCIWAQTGRPRDTTPAGVAAHLNGLPAARGAAGAECFSWVIAHAWSRFRRAKPGAPLNAEEVDVPQDRDAPGTERGYSPVLWACERLAPHVRPVTPQELLWRVRLRLQPRQTLSMWMKELRAAARAGRHGQPARLRHLLDRSGRLLARVDTDPEAGRECLKLLQDAHRLLLGADG